MRTLKFLLLSLLIPLGFAQSSVIPLPPCTLNFTLSNTTLTSGTFPNNAPSCDKWTVTAYVVGTGSFTLTLQAAPPATTSTPGSWATYPGTVATGSNPLTATGIATFTNGTTATQFLRLLLNVTSGTATVYGVLQGSQTVVSKGGGGGGGGGGPTIAGTANEIAAIGAGCTNPSTATCTISIVNNAALPGAPTTTTPAPGDSSSKIATTAFISALLAGCTFTSGNFACPGTISSGVGSGATGALDLVGKTSAATSTVTVDDASTATVVKLPNDATSGLYFATSPTPTPAAGCAQYNGTGTEAVSTASPCGSSSGGSIPIQVNGSPIGSATTINFAAGTNVTQSGAGSGLITVTTNATGAGGGGSPGGSAPVPTAGWSIVNGVVINNFNSTSMGVMIPQNATLNFRFATQALTAPPYTVIATLDCRLPYTQPIPALTCGIYLYDGTQFESFEELTNSSIPTMNVRFSTAVTAGGTILAGPAATPTPLAVWTIKIVDDSTHRTFFYYVDGAFVQFFQESSGANLTPIAVGPGGVDTAAGIQFSDMALTYWCVSASASHCP